MIISDVVAKDKLNEIEQGREEPNPKPTTVSAQQIEQQVERFTQNIASQLTDHVNQQIG